MDERTTGIILRTRPLTETSLIVNWLTADVGRLATVAKGARRPKSPLRGKLDLFFVADFSYLRRRRSSLHLLREVSLRDPHAALRRELRALRQAAYCAALVEQTTETDTPLPGLFDLFACLLRHLSAHPPEAKTVFGFEMKLLDQLGLAPDLAAAALHPGTRRALQRLALLDWPEMATLRLSPAQVMEIRQFLHGFMIFHLERIPSGRNPALNVSSAPSSPSCSTSAPRPSGTKEEDGKGGRDGR